MGKFSTIAVIPARGGSKRIPRKNIVDFMGKPLIAWTIEAALETGLFDKVVVSTDDQEIAALAQDFGAEVPFLREKYSDDVTPVSKVSQYVLEEFKARYQLEFDHVVQLMPNCPIRNSADIINSYRYFEENNIQFQLSCFKFEWMNPWWAVKLNASNEPQALFPEALKTRSQDLEALYCPTGAIWIAQAKVLLEQGTFYGKDYRFYPISWKSAVDIDNNEDLEFAKVIFQKNKVNKRNDF